MAAVLGEAGHEVRAMDASAIGYPRERLLEDVGKEPPDVAIWSTGTPSIGDDLALADELKEVAPNLRTAVFGTHVTALDIESMKATPGLDAIFRNEPEATAAEWVARMAEGGSLNEVSGLTYRSGSEVHHNPDRAFLGNLDDLPDPAWHHFDLDVYRLPLKGKRFLMVTPHRGCPYPCSFCTAQTFYGGKLRRRSVERVVQEIRRNIERYDVREFFFWSDTFTIDKRYVTELSQALEPLGISWASNSRVDTINGELAETMRRAGCWMVSFGIESGDQSLLDEHGKGASVEEAERAVTLSKAAGLKVAGHFVLGLPGETKESLDNTLALARRLPLDFAQFYCAVPFPGARLYERARSEGWLATEDFSRFHQDEALLTLPTIEPGEVMLYREKAYREFYTKPKVALGMLGILSPKFLVRLFTGLGRFMRWSRTKSPQRAVSSRQSAVREEKTS
jgi:radical SAM superfamily enzyme YgiQ (UPF0313 family)